MNNYHVIVVGSRPEKVNNRLVPIPADNQRFICDMLDRVNKSEFAMLYHGAGNDIDWTVDEYAHANGIKAQQFPAYWFNPTKPNNVDKAAGVFRNEAMIRKALDDVYNKADHSVIVLGFYNTEHLKDSTDVSHVIDYATKKGITTRTAQLPVLKGTTPTQETLDFSGSNPASAVPDPFGK